MPARYSATSLKNWSFRNNCCENLRSCTCVMTQHSNCYFIILLPILLLLLPPHYYYYYYYYYYHTTTYCFNPDPHQHAAVPLSIYITKSFFFRSRTPMPHFGLCNRRFAKFQKTVCWLRPYLGAADTSSSDRTCAPSGAPSSVNQLACPWLAGQHYVGCCVFRRIIFVHIRDWTFRARFVAALSSQRSGDDVVK